MDIKKIFKKGQKFAGSKGLIFIEDNWVLVFERDGNTDFYPYHDDLPGGYAEAGETPFETLRRELSEEFGLKLEADEVVYAVERPDVDMPSRTVYFMVAHLRGESRDQIHFGDEGKGYKLVHITEVIEDREFIPGYKEFIKDYVNSSIAPLVPRI